MSILEDIQTVLAPLDIPMETGVFSDEAPATYIVVLPMTDVFDLHADNQPLIDVQEARISLFSKSSYTANKNSIVGALLAADFVITLRQYNGFDTETGYHHYVIDAEKYYNMEE